MRTKGNEFFYSVSGLMVPNSIVDDKLVDYIEILIDQAPILTEQIKRYLNEEKTVAFIMNMKTISDILNGIYAKWLTVEADTIIRIAENNNLVSCRKKIVPFITDLLSLSIDLQVAQKDSGFSAKKSIIELYTDAINNLKAVDTLISNKKYSKAISFISDIELLRQNKNSRQLIKFLEAKDYNNAIDLVKLLKNEYTEILYDVGVILGEDSTKKKLLAVDDHPDILVAVRGMLEPHFNIYSAAGGKTALAIMEKHNPDIFLLDIEMPEISGFELAKTIRATNEHKTTPIIFLTSNATRESVMEAFLCGVNDFIVKPATYNSLMVKISKLLEMETGQNT